MKKYTNEKYYEDIITSFLNNILKNMVTPEYEFTQIVSDNFWDLL